MLVRALDRSDERRQRGLAEHQHECTQASRLIFSLRLADPIEEGGDGELAELEQELGRTNPRSRGLAARPIDQVPEPLSTGELHEASGGDASLLL